MRKTFVVGRLAGSTSRILLLERLTPARPAADVPSAIPARKVPDTHTVH